MLEFLLAILIGGAVVGGIVSGLVAFASLLEPARPDPSFPPAVETLEPLPDPSAVTADTPPKEMPATVWFSSSNNRVESDYEA